MTAFLRGGATQALLPLLFGLVLLPATLVDAALINFENCLDSGLLNSDPLQLQFVPLYFDAKFNSSADGYPLNITIYGNVSGQQVQGDYPPPDDPQWDNPNITFGKIADVGSADKYSTLLANFDVLTYTAYNARARQFCPTLLNASCPLAPAFEANESDPYSLPAFSIAHDFGGSYAFSTLAGTVRVLSGDSGGPNLACVSANITPDLGPSISAMLTWLPAAILILKGIATLAAAIWSPWGSTDIFRWTSNYGRDEDQLRLVTPGFGDCLQYIQFITLTGALSLQYPGFYQPAVSQTSWSLLLFNESFVSHGNGTPNPVDGIYKYNGTYGMTAMSQLIGMEDTEDIWACMAIWLLVIAGIVGLACQLGFAGRWLYHKITDTQEEDLQSKNVPFTLGNMVRLMFNYFILPIVAISLFQLVIAPRSPVSVVVCAVILVVIMVVGGGWIFRVIFTTKPRTILFDDMPTVLLYGPLYNTYSDSAAPFALVPVFITFMRGVALGAIQPSGIAQIIVLAICEVILILTLNGFRPFQNQTSMNAYHTFFAIARLITILLSIAFVPTLGVATATKGWIAYAVLLIHACVLVFGFFLNAAQTLFEVIARSFGVAGDAQTGAIRGSILNLRMLKKRRDRPTGDRASMTSDAAILQDTDARSNYHGGRSRSMSASSQQLLNQIGSGGAPSVHRMSGFEQFSNGGDFVSSPSVDTDNAQAAFTYMPGAAGLGMKPVLNVQTEAERADGYYRPPRVRRTTNPLEPVTPGAKTRQSTASVEFPYKDSPEGAPTSHPRDPSYDSAFYGRDSPAPAYFRDSDHNNGDPGNPRTDYAVREVDQYYRGAALSDQPTRKLKTGPADPEGPAANAQSWFTKLKFGMKGKQQKEPSKGFEVVRSSRLPKEFQQAQKQDEGLELQNDPTMSQDRYRDSPPGQHGDGQTAAGAKRSTSSSSASDKHGGLAHDFNFGIDDARDVADRATRQSAEQQHGWTTDGPYYTQDTEYERSPSLKPSVETESDYERRLSSVGSMQPRPSEAPSLGPIDAGGRLDLPSRFNSRRSEYLHHLDNNPTSGNHDWLRAVDGLSWNHDRPTHATQRQHTGPPLPRRSSRRTPSQDVSDIAPDLLDQQQQQGDVFEGFDSGEASPEDERPSSYSSVSRHRAGDSISRNSFGASAAMHGTSAEIFGRTPPGRSHLEDDFGREG
ncbi:hypothetical protein B0A50_01686 [Salinomyces thailandicus]|uniref:ML-like domain-containing protein n=1 Tax=Salinomyces thailandicus TaxID=706561 RepID=A0A4V5N795_9PEZI|nr:hypothetical protein B0A50_01686 [Salinomyces thailandica]